MAAKKDKMIPSEKERKRALKYATPAGTGRMWVTMGIAFIIFGIILLLIPIGLAISEASAQRYDPESIHTATLVFYLLGAFFGFCGWTCSIRGSPTMKPNIMLSRCGTNCCAKIVSSAAHSMQGLPFSVLQTD